MSTSASSLPAKRPASAPCFFAADNGLQYAATLEGRRAGNETLKAGEQAFLGFVDKVKQLHRDPELLAARAAILAGTWEDTHINRGAGHKWATILGTRKPDFAFGIISTPCLFLEVKPTKQSLQNRKFEELINSPS